jgi:hypothetical protein
MYKIAQQETARLNENAIDEDKMAWTGSVRRLTYGICVILLLVIQTGMAQQTSSDTQTSFTAARKVPEQLGSVNPENLTPLFRETATTRWLAKHRVRAYGWLDGGYSYSSSGNGLLNVAPEPTRFGNEFLLNGAWMIVERPVDTKNWSWGFRSDFYGGSDAALLRPMNNFGPQDKHMGTDFRQLILSAHMPVLTAKGVDLQLGRQNMPLGYETLMAPYRPLYSQTYFWINFQVVATAAVATWHVSNSLDLLGGVLIGYNTVFEMRGRAPDYVTRVTYRPENSTRTTFLGSVITGPKPAPIAAGHTDSWQTIVDIEARRTWTPRFSQVIQASSSWASKDQKIQGGTAATHGASSTATYHMDKQLDMNARGEWFYDIHGVHTGVAGHFGESTLGLSVMPTRWITFRPELRGDFSGQPSFGPVGAANHSRNQLSAAFDMIFKFSAIR